MAGSAVMTVRTGITGSAGTAASAVMAVRTGVEPETCNSSLGTPISALAHKRVMMKTSHPDSPRKYVLRHVPGVIPAHAARYVHPPGVIPAHAAVTSTLGVIPAHAARYVHPGVIPAKAGILTRISFYKGPAVVVNCAGIPSRHLSYAKCDELYILKSLVWIRAICKPKRP